MHSSHHISNLLHYLPGIYKITNFQLLHMFTNTYSDFKNTSHPYGVNIVVFIFEFQLVASSLNVICW